MYLLYDHSWVLSTWNWLLSSGANATKATGVGLNRGSGTNSLAVVEYDRIVYTPLLAVYNSCTPSGISCIEYLHSVYVYIILTLYTILSSGAYCGGRLTSVREVAAQNHRDYMVINTGAAIYLEWNHRRKSHLSTVDYITNSYIRIFLLWLMRHTKNSHNSALFHTLLHYRNYHTLRSGANTHDQPPLPISISHFFASTEQLYVYVIV